MTAFDSTNSVPTLTPAQMDAISAAVRARRLSCGVRSPVAFWSALKRRYGVKKYYYIPAAQFEDAIRFINSYTPAIDASAAAPAEPAKPAKAAAPAGFEPAALKDLPTLRSQALALQRQIKTAADNVVEVLWALEQITGMTLDYRD